MRQVSYTMALPASEGEVRTIVSESVPEKAPRQLMTHMQGPPEFKMVEQTDQRVLPVHRYVDMTTESSPELRKTAYDVDLHCLDKLGGCDRGQILPALSVSDLDRRP